MSSQGSSRSGTRLRPQFQLLKGQIIAGFKIMYSGLYNPRRTESPAYVLWSAFFQSLIPEGSQSILLPCPQFEIYRSKNDFYPPDKSNADSSTRTEADSSAEGVFPDHALLLFHFGVTPSAGQTSTFAAITRKLSLFVDSLQEFISSTWHREVSRSISLPWLDVPALGEIKRPRSRHPRSIKAYVTDVRRTLVTAQKQVLQQAHCLFSSPKYGLQRWVIVIAATGEWYTYRILSRKEFIGSKSWSEPFNPDEYDIPDLLELEVGEVSEGGVVLDVVEADELDAVEAKLDCFLGPEEAAKMAIQQIAPTTAAATAAPASKPSDPQLTKKAKGSKKPDSSRDENAWPFTENELSTAFARYPDPFPEGGVGPRSQGHEDPYTGVSSREWSSILRVGTHDSDAALAEIRLALSKLVGREYRRLKKLGSQAHQGY